MNIRGGFIYTCSTLDKNKCLMRERERRERKKFLFKNVVKCWDYAAAGLR
jgi:hypothetical protein